MDTKSLPKHTVLFMNIISSVVWQDLRKDTVASLHTLMIRIGRIYKTFGQPLSNFESKFELRVSNRRFFVFVRLKWKRNMEEWILSRIAPHVFIALPFKEREFDAIHAYLKLITLEDICLFHVNYASHDLTCFVALLIIFELDCDRTTWPLFLRYHLLF